MIKHLSLLPMVMLLASCQNEAVFLKAINYDVGPPAETINLKLNGTSTRGRDGWGMTHAQAKEFLKSHQGETVNYYGMIHDIIVHENRATLEIVPPKTGSMQQNCTVRELLQRYGGKNCEPEKTRSFTAVYCMINDWKALNQKTQGLLLGNFKTRANDHKKWDTLHIEGNLSFIQPKKRGVTHYDGGVNLQFGTGGGFSRKYWHYDTLIVHQCKVRGFDHQRL